LQLQVLISGSPVITKEKPEIKTKNLKKIFNIFFSYFERYYMGHLSQIHNPKPQPLLIQTLFIPSDTPQKGSDTFP